MNALAKSFEDDGYKLAKDIEDGVSEIQPNAELVDVLDHFGMDIHHALSTARQQWVKDTGWKPSFKIGDQVKFTLHRGTVHDGVITDLKEEEGIYTISKDLKARKHSGGYIIDNDKVKAP